MGMQKEEYKASPLFQMNSMSINQQTDGNQIRSFQNNNSVNTGSLMYESVNNNP